MNIMGVDLVLTCGACPEQYDALIDGRMVGYLRLRHGRFTVSVPGWGGEIIYSASPDGDGVFTDDERDFYLGAAVAKILERYEA